MKNKLRFAEYLAVVEAAGFIGLPDSLENQKIAEPTHNYEPVPKRGAEIIPFRAKEPQHRCVQPLAVLTGA